MRLPLSAIEAFAEDVRRSSTASRPGDERVHAWLSIASAAEILGTLRGRNRLEFLEEIDGSLLPPADQRPSIVHDTLAAPEHGLEAYVERFRVAAEEMERGGYLNLAFSTVSALNRALTGESVEPQLMNTVHLGRIARQLSDTRTAIDCYRTVAREGLRNRDGPSAARAYIGLAMVAVMRGNYPLVRRLFERALLHAHPRSNTQALAHMGLCNVARREHRLADALIHGWEAHDTVTDLNERLGIIGNLATIALDAGFPAAAMSGYQHVLAMSPVPEVRLGALHDAVIAAADLGDIRQLEALEREAMRTANEYSQPFEIARVALNVATAWRRAGDATRAREVANQALEIATTHGFNELSVRAELALDELDAPQKPKRQTPASTSWSSEFEAGIHRLEALGV